MANSTSAFTGNSVLMTTGESQVTFDNMTLSLNDNATLYLSTSTYYDLNNFSKNQFNAFINSTILLSSSTTFELDHTFALFITKLFTIKDNATIYMHDGSFMYLDCTNNTLQGNSSVLVRGASLLGLSTPDSTLLQINSSKLILNDGSHFEVEGSYTAQDSVAISLSNQSLLVVRGQYNQQGMATMKTNNAFIVIEGGCSFKESAVGTFTNDSRLHVNGTLSFQDRSILSLDSSKVSVPGTLTVSSTIQLSNSTISVIGLFNTNGNITALNSLIDTNGTANFGGNFKGESSNITVTNGNLSIIGASMFNCTNSHISVISGNFIYDTQSSIHMINTSFINLNGHVESQGHITVFPGCTMSNNGTFNLQSSILKSSTNVNDIIFENTGTFSSLHSSEIKEIMIPFNNNGQVNINSSLTLSLFTQSDGITNIANGTVLGSNNTVDIQGGYLAGRNGTILASLTINGTLGYNQSTYQPTSLQVVGNLTQHSQGTMVVIINSERDFTEFNITEKATFDGELVVKINKEFFVSSKSINVVNFNEASGQFANVKIKSFDPNSNNKESDHDDCNYVVGQDAKSLRVLVSCKSGKSKLSTGAIVGIVIACVVVVVVVGSLLHLRKKIVISYKLKSGIFKLRKLNK
ncbi:hypothetical protein SAMD00019534_109800 [Acytostelium subglobosum LB1]|uniref:hypothetical protein n=1 Tax=Acytostelium subglobosum LB1 TaxID=1410327 RepID=UPI000644DED9|nr:hypothetical protein SAMD00019534_109800 [Acytostelium subglobosum LB1]GAM27804.1 hypothetical protein SAMD00019534_109800 [Acytostelium subglobosum LB1]|eukprot:XP_012749087.1 hypothetical protein SAMD00019534_109800 [Acytostelium subglobosum LB1]